VAFSGDKAYAHVLAQMDFGPRVVGSEAHWQAGEYIQEQLLAAGWEVEVQEFEYDGIGLRNFIARVGEGQGPVVIVGAHYDSRRYADHDPVTPLAPVPGANDGASGVAVLLELARTVDRERLANEVWLAFFDAEDDGGIDGWPWIVGSTYMAHSLTVEPEYVVVVDMIGDADQQIYLDINSDVEVAGRIWALAASLGYGQYFIPVPKYAMLDDHTPFAQLGIPAVDIIDFDYPYWHTTADTADKVSPASLERVGRTVEALLEGDSSPATQNP
jgi:Zn-dependent M28 family amino/carboxypeptidase